MTEPAVEFRDVHFRYDGPPVLEGATFTIGADDFAGVIGPNGSGKTTLLRLLLGLLRPTSGRVLVFGEPPARARRRLGYVPQSPDLDPRFPISAEDVVLMGRLGRSQRVGPFRGADRAAAREAMEQTEVWPLRRQRYGSLSGGQRQRVLIARALATRPRLLVLDEPTAGVDHRIEHEIYCLLDRLHESVPIVMVTHDVGCITEHVSLLVCVHSRVHVHRPEDLTGDVIEALYRGPEAMLGHSDTLTGG